MMDDWNTFAQISKQTHPTGDGGQPKVLNYLAIKFIDNFLTVSVFLLTVFFSIIALFVLDSANQEKLNWALHAAELCLGIFLGLLKGTGK